MRVKGNWGESDYFAWRSIITAIPSEWKRTLYKSKSLDIPPRILENLGNVNSKSIYWKLIENKFSIPTAQNYISNKLRIPDIEWSEVYQNVYLVTNDVKLRAFQYKILNNCLFLSKDLFRFHLVDSPNCVFCKTEKETMEHLFVECHFSKVFYSSAKNWLRTGGIILPELNLKNVILGSGSDLTTEFLFVLYKYVLYLYRSKGLVPKLVNFQAKLQEYVVIEFEIAKRSKKLDTHFRKYEKILDLL